MIDRLTALDPGVRWEPLVITTSGDRSGRTGAALTGDGAFVKEIQRALADGEIDAAVHSLKDLPTEPVAGLVVAAVPAREDPHDALVGAALDELTADATVGTGSPRRRAQLLHARPDLTVVPIRGNVPTRIAAVRSGPLQAVVLAAAGLARLGLEADDILPARVMLPAPGQGALGVECRADDAAMRARLATIDHPPTAAAAHAERAVLRRLGGGCLLPVGALGDVRPDGMLTLDAAVTAADGTRQARVSGTAPVGDAAGLAARLARELADRGALEILGAGA